MTHTSFLSRISSADNGAAERTTLLFGGQATPWRAALTELAEDPTLADAVRGVLADSGALIAPVAAQVTAATAGALTLERLIGAGRAGAVSAALSVPGITVAQFGQLAALKGAGFDAAAAVAADRASVLGHSQGVLGAALVDGRAGDSAHVIAIARLIGAAASRATLAVGVSAGDATPMLSVRGLDRDTLDAVLAEVAEQAGGADTGVQVAIRNGHRRFILSGAPDALGVVEKTIAVVADKDAAELAAKTRGGAPLAPVCEYLDVTVPFHHDMMETAVAQVVAWADTCGLAGAEALARAVLTDHVDWVDGVTDALASGTSWFLDLGPGDTVTKLSSELVEGSGAGLVAAGSLTAVDALAAPGEDPARTVDWSSYSPRLVDLPTGRTVETKFTRLTGRSPILLAGMTPTTVDPEIVAAAANAGYWAEMAGGGQVTAEVFDANLTKLKGLLDPGRAVQFNAMFMDRYLWNLHFGTQRVVSKARESGAPLDGVVISAGIPEPDEAPEVIGALRNSGFSHIALKPGTVAQIRAGLGIARQIEDTGTSIILQVEDGHAGGHHSWENLDDLLTATYAEIRRQPNVVLCVGGGIGTPERAADYLSGSWSTALGLPAMPVDGVLVGTAAMTAKEAKTTREIKQLLVDTPGVADQTGSAVTAPNGGWIAPGQAAGGATSGLSHLRADIHEIDNSAAKCMRLIQEIGSNLEAVNARRDEIIAALNKTAKPYFGELEEMTYAQVVRRFAELSFPWADPSWLSRFHLLLQRVEARLSDVDHGEVVTLFPTEQDAAEPTTAIARLIEAYPASETDTLTPLDTAWFLVLCRKFPKPVGFVPAIDEDLLAWWGKDCLWQSQDDRYTADQCRIIPGPVSVSGITTIDEPVASILGRFEDACRDRVAGTPEAAVGRHSLEDASASTEVVTAWSRQDDAADVASFLKATPYISWTGHLMDNPAHVIDESKYELIITDDGSDGGPVKVTIDLHLDTFWDGTAAGEGKSKVHAVRRLPVPLILSDAVATGALPVVDEEKLPTTMYGLLAGTAGVGNVAVTGDEITAMPGKVEGSETPETPFGTFTYTFHLTDTLGAEHAGVTGAGLPDLSATGSGSRSDHRATIVPDALLGTCWPAIYAALGSALVDGYPVIEGLLNAVHLDHSVALEVPAEDIATGEITVTSWAAGIEESSSGRVVTVHHHMSDADGALIGKQTERFAIRGRAFGTTPPADPAPAGGIDRETTDTPRSTLLRARVNAPAEMTPFAWVSGDFNPIHTSHVASRVAGLTAPLVHGMWLSATAQHAASAAGAGHKILGWTYRMFGLVQLGDPVDIQVERVGRVAGGGLALDVTCRINDELVSQGTAVTAAPTIAYVYPGQGIQAKGMGLDERSASKAAASVWERADRHTREALDFSILTVVRDNPTELTAKGVTYHHPDGVLYLTQFTQVALATLALAQTARLREADALVADAYYAGHSLGEYTALSAYAGTIELETVLEVVFHRGSTMHHLIPRDEHGRSDYRMGALRPNQFGVDDEHVVEYVNSVAEASGEFLEIVNFNLAGEQYSIAGTVAGLAALEKDATERTAAHGGKGSFMMVPGIDVPFHSRVLHPGVPDFREKLDALLPPRINHEILVGRYIPNLVARPFELTPEFVESILEVVPSEPAQALLDNWNAAVADDAAVATTARTLFIELLCWQFASPVRWIETQDLLFAPDRLDIDEVVEVGLGASPTLANLATKTLKLPRFSAATVAVRNVQRDEKLVYHTDQQTIDAPVYEEEPTSVPVGDPVLSGAKASEKAPSESVPESLPAPVPEAAELRTAPPAPAGAVERPADLPYKASDAIKTLLAYANKLRPEQIGGADTTGTLTNGVSSRLNQLLMDISAELGLSAVEGAAEADVDTLSVTVNAAAHNYSAFGPVLGEAVKDRLRKLFGAAGAKATAIADRLTGTWELGPGWVDHTTAQILLGSREGASSRGGDLATLATGATTMNDVNAIIDEAVAQVGAAHGIPVAIPAAGGSGGGTVDSAALDAFAEGVTGETGVLATTARHILAALGLDVPESAVLADPDGGETAAVLEAVSAELGANWPATVAPSFDARRALLIDDRWATAREDVARLANGEELAGSASFRGTGETVATHASYRAAEADAAGDATLAARFRDIADEARRTDTGKFTGTVAVVTGVTPASIAGGVVGDLLAEGATVVMTASRISSARLEFAKKLYREHASASAQIWLVPANLSSYRDIDALVEWIGTEQTETVGSDQKLIKPALVPDLFLPFAAPSVSGTVEDAGGNAEIQARLLLWSVERSFTALSRIGHDADLAHRLHVVLPGSPNRGTFGGDGAYGEVKAAFDAIGNKWHNEPWGERVTIAHPRIGWVAGTGLMGGNDPLVDAAIDAGVHVWSPAEISSELLALCSEEVRTQALNGPVDADLTGGLGKINLVELRDQAMAENAAAASDVDEDATASPVTVNALPSPVRVAQPVGADHSTDAWGDVSLDLDDMVVVVGLGEVSAWGSGRTRFEAELGVQADGSVDLSAAGVLELAWMTGLLSWMDTPVAGWYDVDGNIVPEEEIYTRYRDEVAARAGVRSFVDDVAIEDLHTPQQVEIFLDHEVTFTVDSAEDAATFVDADPTFTRANHDAETGEWSVTRLPGARTRVPRRATLARKVGGQFPTDFNPARWGIPASMIEAVDRIAIWNLVTAVDAYLSAGFTPAEILQAVHPSDIAMTQGTGFGGMTSMRKLFVDRFLEEEIPSDILQETLPNVIAAHTMQSYVGGYGAMIHPVGACATAAVSVEEGVDKIKLGKADFVVAGATDDINVESITGFANMNATADSDKMAAKGLNERFYSRSNDRRRGGFVEAQGGGTILLARGSVAAKLGLPVQSVVGYAASFADGAHTSIPAPGQGALAAGRGGKNSRLAKDLAKLGVSADDISVVSKHDTSTNANDPNESTLHTRLASVLGRTPGNPLYVVSQKTLTGHAKGGAAVFQTAGLGDMFRTSHIPANRALDCVDPEMASSPELVWLREPLKLSRTVKAGLLTSLGFGHVSALLALVHPEAFRTAVAAQLGEPAAAEWVERASERLRAGVRRREAGMLGHRALFEEIEHRRFADGVDIDEAEPAMLLDPEARAGADGLFR
ncbi:type I polyketide synthase [Corynebacterium terpenotabidum]|uniref:Fatty acid synthase n=1 Tax=Corynebacterium terpenotabidum Y-11 TaxID=1200352 RepID=S4XF69_9CORY|nr:type I polyketide synthase [Corynebacterium terpenotabidum]AGP31782.1 fatty acid synthase [Corynebacterium terpenotabidum Y-11]